MQFLKKKALESGPRPFLIVARTRTQLVELRRVKRLIDETAGCQSILFVESQTLLDEPGSRLIPGNSNVRGTQALFRSMLLRAFAFFFFSFAHCESRRQGIISAEILVEYRRNLKLFRRVLQGLKPAGIVVAEDGLGGNFVLVEAARRLRIPTYIVPYEYSGRRQIHEQIRRVASSIEAELVRGKHREVAAKKFKKWVDNLDDSQKVFRVPWPMILAIESAGLTIDNPWTVHGGSADVLCAESEKMIEHYRREGVPERKLRLTGSLAHDDLFRKLEVVAQEKPRGLTILCALPPDYFDAHCPSAFQDYEALIRYWVGVLGSVIADVIYQAHPAAREKLRALNISGLKLDNRDITELIARSDILVTSVSSIIRLAIGARKPVVNFDVYKFDYDDYRDVPGVATVSSAFDFEQAIRAMAFAPNCAEISEMMKERAGAWAMLDGGVAERLKSALGISALSRPLTRRNE